MEKRVSVKRTLKYVFRCLEAFRIKNFFLADRVSSDGLDQFLRQFGRCPIDAVLHRRDMGLSDAD